TLTNAGTAIWLSTALTQRLDAGGVINNLAGATFDVHCDGNIQGGTFNNDGTFRKSQSTGQTTLNISFNNRGTVEVQTGTLEVNSHCTASGTFTADAGAILAFDGGVHTLTASSVVNGPGNVSIGPGTTNVLGAFAPRGTVTVATDVVNF